MCTILSPCSSASPWQFNTIFLRSRWFCGLVLQYHTHLSISSSGRQWTSFLVRQKHYVLDAQCLHGWGRWRWCHMATLRGRTHRLLRGSRQQLCCGQDGAGGVASWREGTVWGRLFAWCSSWKRNKNGLLLSEICNDRLLSLKHVCEKWKRHCHCPCSSRWQAH